MEILITFEARAVLLKMPIETGHFRTFSPIELKKKKKKNLDKYELWGGNQSMGQASWLIDSPDQNIFDSYTVRLYIYVVNGTF